MAQMQELAFDDSMKQGRCTQEANDRPDTVRAGVSSMTALLALGHRAVQQQQDQLWQWCVQCATPLAGADLLLWCCPVVLKLKARMPGTLQPGSDHLGNHCS